MTSRDRFPLRSSPVDWLRAIQEGVRVPFAYERERALKFVGVGVGAAVVATNPVALGATAAALAYFLWTRRSLVKAMIRMNRMVLPPLELVPWTPRWAEEVAAEKVRLESHFSPFRAQFKSGLIHLGSTAVEGIRAAKPMHDAVLLVRDDNPSPELIRGLEDLGYFVIGTSPHAPEGGDTWAVWLPRDADERERMGAGFSLHLTGPSGKPRVTNMLQHARFLQTFPEEAVLYSEAKRAAASNLDPRAGNYRTYVEEKYRFLEGQLARSRAWHEKSTYRVDLERDYPFGTGTLVAQAAASATTPAAK